ncbi:MAG: hypothetical protein RSC41_05970, partial [Oscillospiraceae bacterium]
LWMRLLICPKGMEVFSGSVMDEVTHMPQRAYQCSQDPFKIFDFANGRGYYNINLICIATIL